MSLNGKAPPAWHRPFWVLLARQHPGLALLSSGDITTCWLGCFSVVVLSPAYLVGMTLSSCLSGMMLSSCEMTQSPCLSEMMLSPCLSEMTLSSCLSGMTLSPCNIWIDAVPPLSWGDAVCPLFVDAVVLIWGVAPKFLPTPQNPQP